MKAGDTSLMVWPVCPRNYSHICGSDNICCQPKLAPGSIDLNICTHMNVFPVTFELCRTHTFRDTVRNTWTSFFQDSMNLPTAEFTLHQILLTQKGIQYLYTSCLSIYKIKLPWMLHMYKNMHYIYINMYTMCKTYGTHTIRGVAWVFWWGWTNVHWWKSTDWTFLVILN